MNIWRERKVRVDAAWTGADLIKAKVRVAAVSRSTKTSWHWQANPSGIRPLAVAPGQGDEPTKQEAMAAAEQYLNRRSHCMRHCGRAAVFHYRNVAGDVDLCGTCATEERRFMAGGCY